jgi:hypothetical protein
MARVVSLASEVYPEWTAIGGFGSDGVLTSRSLDLPPIIGMSSLVEVKNASFAIPASVVEPRDLIVQVNAREYLSYRDSSYPLHGIHGRTGRFHYMIRDIVGEDAVLTPIPYTDTIPAGLLTPRITELLFAVPMLEASQMGLGSLKRAIEQKQGR